MGNLVPLQTLKTDHVPGGKIKATHLNSAFDFIKQTSRRQVDGIPNRVNHLLCTAKKDIPPFSFFSLDSFASFDTHAVDVHDGNAIYMGVYTNEEHEVKSGFEFYAQPVTPNSIHIGRFLDVPTVGMPCGIVSKSLTLSKEFTGLICLSNELDPITVNGEEYSSLYNVTVPNEKGHFLGVTTEDVTPFNPSGGVLGKGDIIPQIRSGLSPATESAGFSFDAYNFQPFEIKEDTLVAVLPFINVGLVMIPLTSQDPLIGVLQETATAGTATGPGGPFDLKVQDWLETTKLYFDKPKPFAGTSPWIVEVWNQCEEITLGERVQVKPVCGKYMIDVVCCPPP